MINYEMALSEIEMYRKAHEGLSESLKQANNQTQQFKAERDTLIDDLTWYKAKVSRLERENRFLISRKDNLFDSWRDENKRSVALSKKLEQLEQENKRLTRLTHKLTIHRIMWDSLKDWRRDMLEIDKNDTQLIGLGLVMDELEKRHLYKEDK